MTHGWYAATVPGTVLTSLVNDHVYPEPLYGENERPEIIPESLCHTSYWYRTVIRVPRAYRNRRVWLNFDGINYSADVWVNGVKGGQPSAAHSSAASSTSPRRSSRAGRRWSPCWSRRSRIPAIPTSTHCATASAQNGGITAIDGPTFLSTIGWDWLNAVRDRDTGIWQKVYLSATGPVRAQGSAGHHRFAAAAHRLL